MTITVGKPTPPPWTVGVEGVISTGVPYAESRERNWDVSQAIRNNRPIPTDYPHYGGELVCESCTLADQILIVANARQVPMLMDAMRLVLERSTEPKIRVFVSATLLTCEAVTKTVMAEAEENRERGQAEREARWLRENIAGYLPAEASPNSSPPEFQPSHKFVTDNIELAWLVRNRMRDFSDGRYFWNFLVAEGCPF